MSATRSYGGIHIEDIPDIIIANVAEYLATPSRAILALALTTHPSSWRKFNWIENSPILKWAAIYRRKKQPSSATKSILSPPHKKSKRSSKLLWEVLDFGEVERSLAAKLTDDDIAGILACINSVKRLKTLKLTGCVNIIGHGLEPLRGSLVLEHLDLSLVGQHERPELKPEPLLSEDGILPILSSIVDVDRYGSSLRYLVLPQKLRDDWALGEFLEDYNQLLHSRMLTCSKCKLPCTDTPFLEFYSELPPGVEECPWDYGIQGFTCAACEKFYCIRAECDWLIGSCKICTKEYCKNCIEVLPCTSCDGYFCKQCKALDHCNLCWSDVCEKCIERCEYCNRYGCKNCLDWRCCEKCNKSHCRRCFDGNGRNVQICDKCHEHYCSGCQFSKCSASWKDACKGCLRTIGINPSLAQNLNELTSSLCGEIVKLQHLVRDISVEGCGVPAVNGVYIRSGDYRNAPKFCLTTIHNGERNTFMLLKRLHEDDKRARWYICKVHKNFRTGTEKGVDFYAADDTPFSTLPPRVGWSCIADGGGAMPAPRLVYPINS